MNVPPVAADGTIAYGLPTTVAVLAAPVLVKVTLPTVSPFCNAEVVKADVPKLNVVPYVLLCAFAVMVNGAALTIKLPVA